LRLAVIGTFYKRYDKTIPLLRRIYLESTRKPDESWLMCETQDDRDCLEAAAKDIGYQPGLRIVQLETPRDGGRYMEIPYSRKINWALDHTSADCIVYVDNNSMPDRDKFKVVMDGLEKHGAVYVTQHRTGYRDEYHRAQDVIEDGYCQVNYTQVAHRVGPARWPTDMQWAEPDLADANYWRELHKFAGSFHPVGDPEVVLDVHEIGGSAADLS
jgi:hypothetical protein